MAHHLCRLVGHGYHAGRMTDTAAVVEDRMALDQRRKHSLIAVQNCVCVWKPGQGSSKARNHRCRPVVAPHGVYGNDNAL